MSALPLTFLLISALNSSLIDPSGCLARSFYGTYGSRSVFGFPKDSSCMDEFNVFRLGLGMSPSTTYDAQEDHQLVWLEQKTVTDDLKSSSRDNLEDFFARLATGLEDNGQHFLGYEYGRNILASTSTSMLVSIPSHLVPTLDTLLPPFWKPLPLPSTPLPLMPVPTPAVDRVKRLLSTLKFNPTVASLLSNISISHMRADLRWLTGEDSRSPIVSRHSFNSGSRLAAAWLKEQFEDTGATCELRTFLDGFAPNVVCHYPASKDPNSTVLISAHYDSRGSFGSTRAPGANDDGSGTVALLSIARTIKRRGIKFRSAVEFCAFAGEEQGLYGSRARARELRTANASITLMIQADMIGYLAPGEPPQLGLPYSIGTREVTQLVANVSGIYSPELTVGFTPACCSDHQSFHEQGFPATQVFERAGPIADPMYHNSGDLSDRDGYSLALIRSIAKVQFATLLHAAGFDLDDEEDAKGGEL